MKNFKNKLSVILLSVMIGATTFGANPVFVHADEVTTVNTDSSTTEASSEQSDEIIDYNSTYEVEDYDSPKGDPIQPSTAVKPATKPATQATTAVKPATKPATQATTETQKTETKKTTTKQKTTKKKTTKKKVTKEQKVDEWLDVCDDMLRNMKKHHYRYSNSGGGSTYRSSLKRSHRTNCALFVSWCLQEYGAISKGKTFYMRGSSIRKSFSRWGNKVKVIRVNRRCSSTKLQKGDVICWSSASHVNIYAGKSKSGKKLWYDGGKVATAGNSFGSRYVHTGKRSLSYLNGRRIAYIIRIKF